MSYPRIIHHELKVARCDDEFFFRHSFIRPLLAEVVDDLKQFADQNVTWGRIEFSFKPQFNEELLLTEHISDAANYVKPYLEPQYCGQCKRGMRIDKSRIRVGEPLLLQHLLSERYVKLDMNGAVVHAATHLVSNLCAIACERAGLPLPKNQPDVVVSLAEDSPFLAYRYYWFMGVGYFTEIVKNHMELTVSALMHIVNGDPIATRMSAENWMDLLQQLTLLSTEDPPWCRIRLDRRT